MIYGPSKTYSKVGQVARMSVDYSQISISWKFGSRWYLLQTDSLWFRIRNVVILSTNFNLNYFKWSRSPKTPVKLSKSSIPRTAESASSRSSASCAPYSPQSPARVFLLLSRHHNRGEHSHCHHLPSRKENIKEVHIPPGLRWRHSSGLVQWGPGEGSHCQMPPKWYFKCHVGKGCLVLSYGVTNSGKTFTIFGNDKDPGLLPVLVASLPQG